jgi:glycosyltransferase domain-containing protein
MTSKVTIVIPTKSRPDFLARLLTYYRDTGFLGCICVGDSSESDHLERNRLLIKSLSDRINIIYKEYPKLNAISTMGELINYIETPYAAICCDDDFLIPSALVKSSRFLDENLEYNAAWGKAVKVRLENNGAFGQVAYCKPIKQPVLDAESGSQRYINYMMIQQTDVLYAVQRSKNFIRAYSPSNIKDMMFAGGVLPNAMSCVHGKNKEYDHLFLVRQDHDERLDFTERTDALAWITNQEFSSSYLGFQEVVVNELANQDGITKEEAQSAVRQGFLLFLQSKLINESKKRNYVRYNDSNGKMLFKSLENKKEHTWKRLARNIPGLAGIWQLIKKHNLISRKLDSSHNMSLKALLDSSSPYHQDFISIYNAITKPPET